MLLFDLYTATHIASGESVEVKDGSNWWMQLGSAGQEGRNLSREIPEASGDERASADVETKQNNRAKEIKMFILIIFYVDGWWFCVWTKNETDLWRFDLHERLPDYRTMTRRTKKLLLSLVFMAHLFFSDGMTLGKQRDMSMLQAKRTKLGKLKNTKKQDIKNDPKQ